MDCKHKWIETRGEYVCCECGLVGDKIVTFPDINQQLMSRPLNKIKTKRERKTTHWVLMNVPGTAEKKRWFIKSMNKVLRKKLMKRETIANYLEFIYSRNTQQYCKFPGKHFSLSNYAEIVNILNISVRSEDVMLKVSKLIAEGKWTWEKFNTVFQTQCETKCTFKKALELHGLSLSKLNNRKGMETRKYKKLTENVFPKSNDDTNENYSIWNDKEIIQILADFWREYTRM